MRGAARRRFLSAERGPGGAVASVRDSAARNVRCRRPCLRAAVADVVAEQAEVGIDVVSDGEFGKTFTWAFYIRDRLEGFEEPLRGVGDRRTEGSVAHGARPDPVRRV